MATAEVMVTERDAVIPEADHSLVFSQYFLLGLLEDDRTVDPLGALARALLSSLAEEVLGALVPGHYC